MSKVERFEDLIAWQKARQLAGQVYQISREGAFAKDWGLANQMQRAAVSVMSNIAEGYERRSEMEFFQFLSISKASCAEVRSLLYLAFDIGYLTSERFQEIMAQAEETARVVGGLRASVGRKRTQ